MNDRRECEWCEQPAAAELSAQWTIADFDTYLACRDHQAAAERHARRILVNGQHVQQLYWRYFE